MPRPLRWCLWESRGDAFFDLLARHHVRRSRKGDDLLEAQAGERGRERLDEARIDRRAVAHELRPRMKVVRLRQGRGVRQAELAGKTLRVERPDAKCDERAGVAEDGVLKAVRQL